MNHVIIYGATSAIAQEIARQMARRGDQLFLVARHEGHLRIVAEDLQARTQSKVGWLTADLNDLTRHEEIWDTAKEFLEFIDTVVIAHGVLGDQAQAQSDMKEVSQIFATNTLSPISILTGAANHLIEGGRGSILAIGSPAGERGRQSNYIYGASKGALAIFLSGLRNRLTPHGIPVTTVLPGFVDTPMTKAFKKGPLWAQPQDVAKRIIRALDQGERVVYAPWFWRWIMLIIRCIPESIFVRLRL